MQDNRYYRTRNFYLSCYLYAKEQQLVNIDKTQDPNRVEFVFLDSPELGDLVESFNFAKEALIDARTYSLAIKSLKSKLYDNKD